MGLWFYYSTRMDTSFWKRKLGIDRHQKSPFPIIKRDSLKYVAALFDCELTKLYEIANCPSKFYKTFYIPKRNGGRRRIDSPLYPLDQIQKWILIDILYHIPCSHYAKAYVPKTSVNDNAKYHRNQKLVMTLDIKDFFSSIAEKHVFNVFRNQCGFEEPVAVFFTKLCTYNGSLPQGAPTSAYLSNLVLKEFDEAVADYCKLHGVRFSRYADDMTFSGDFDIAALLHVVDQQLNHLGLCRHPEKLKIMRRHDRQKTTGIVVNVTKQVPREYRMKIRQEVHYIKTYGLDDHVSRIGEEKNHYLQSLLGRINHVLRVNPQDAKMASYYKYIDVLKTLEAYK